MKRLFLLPVLMLSVVLLSQGFFVARAEAWDIVGDYKYADKRYNYTAEITVTRDYRISVDSRIVGGICGFNGQIRDREKKKITKQLSANPQSVEVAAWNGEKGKNSEELIFLFTPDTVILKRGSTKFNGLYCGQRLQLPDASEVFKKVK